MTKQNFDVMKEERPKTVKGGIIVRASVIAIILGVVAVSAAYVAQNPERGRDDMVVARNEATPPDVPKPPPPQTEIQAPQPAARQPAPPAAEPQFTPSTPPALPPPADPQAAPPDVIEPLPPYRG